MRTSVDNKTMSISFSFNPQGLNLINNYTVTVVLWDDDPPEKKSTQYNFQVSVIRRVDDNITERELFNHCGNFNYGFEILKN